MTGWEKDKRWSDRFLPEIKRALGECLISEPPVEDDAERNTDLMVLRLDAVRIACRIRKHEYLSKYGNEFTIRTGRPSGVKTELTKIVEGWGNYLFYGFSDECEKSLSQWIVGDLNAFRLYFCRYLTENSGAMPGTCKNNVDNSSSFRAFRYSEIPGFVIASKTIHNLALGA